MSPAVADPQPTPIAVLGATGGLGRHVVRLALERGWPVRAMARTPGNVVPAHGLEVIEGSFDDPAALERTVRGTRAVFNCIGYAKGSAPALYGEGARHLVTAMHEARVSRLISISGAGLELPGDEMTIGRRLIIGLLRLVAKPVLTSKQLEWEAIEGSGLDWTLVRVARMVERAPTGRVKVDTRRVAGSPIVAYADVAAWMLDQVERDELVGAAPFVAGG